MTYQCGPNSELLTSIRSKELRGGDRTGRKTQKSGWRGVKKSLAVPPMPFRLVSKAILCLKGEVNVVGFRRTLCARDYF